jgi:hypothetical protein
MRLQVAANFVLFFEDKDLMILAICGTSAPRNGAVASRDCLTRCLFSLGNCLQEKEPKVTGPVR